MRSNAANPTATFREAASRNELRMPIAGMRMYPVSSVPDIAPSVFKAYRRLTLVAAEPLCRDNAAVSSGSVMPIMVVGIARIANEHTSRATVRTVSDSAAELCNAT